MRTDQADVADGKILMTFGNRMTFVKNKRKCATIFAQQIENKVLSISLTRTIEYCVPEDCDSRVPVVGARWKNSALGFCSLLVGERLLLPVRMLSARLPLCVRTVPGTDQMSEMMADF